VSNGGINAGAGARDGNDLNLRKHSDFIIFGDATFPISRSSLGRLPLGIYGWRSWLDPILGLAIGFGLGAVVPASEILAGILATFCWRGGRRENATWKKWRARCLTIEGVQEVHDVAHLVAGRRDNNALSFACARFRTWHMDECETHPEFRFREKSGEEFFGSITPLLQLERAGLPATSGYVDAGNPRKKIAASTSAMAMAAS